MNVCVKKNHLSATPAAKPTPGWGAAYLACELYHRSSNVNVCVKKNHLSAISAAKPSPGWGAAYLALLRVPPWGRTFQDATHLRMQT